MEVLRESPCLCGRELHEAVVRRITGLDARAAARVVGRAEVSYANWPVERDPRFRDVVQYLAAGQCLAGRPTDEGILTPPHLIIGQQVPENLQAPPRGLPAALPPGMPARLRAARAV